MENEVASPASTPPLDSTWCWYSFCYQPSSRFWRSSSFPPWNWVCFLFLFLCFSIFMTKQQNNPTELKYLHLSYEKLYGCWWRRESQTFLLFHQIREQAWRRPSSYLVNRRTWMFFSFRHSFWERWIYNIIFCSFSQNIIFQWWSGKINTCIGPLALKFELYNGTLPSLVTTTYSWTKVAESILIYMSIKNNEWFFLIYIFKNLYSDGQHSILGSACWCWLLLLKNSTS